VPHYYLTTPIYYVNDAPHVGTAYTTVNADALARWHRLLGDDVWFMTGTDEHGAKIVEAAEANDATPKEWTDRTSERFVEAWRALGIQYDDFIRTTEPRHYKVVQEFLQRIYDNGFIELGLYSGLYCVSCEDYYTEDQLVDGKCPVHGRPVIEMQEDNYFFKLSAFEQRLLDYYEAHPDFVRPVSKRNEALGFIRGGLRDVSITRTSFTWGVPVPWDSGHVFYVWYDALINYLTVAGYGADEATFKARWGAAHHLIGKDILKFHCVWWPAMCMAAGIEPPAEIFVHGYLLMGGQKLGKTMIAAGLSGDEGSAKGWIDKVFLSELPSHHLPHLRFSLAGRLGSFPLPLPWDAVGNGSSPNKQSGHSRFFAVFGLACCALRVKTIYHAILHFIRIGENVALVKTQNVREVVYSRHVAVDHARFNHVFPFASHELAIKDAA